MISKVPSAKGGLAQQDEWILIRCLEAEIPGPEGVCSLPC